MPSKQIWLIAFLSLFLLFTSCQPNSFDGSRAFSYIETQVAFGPRIPGSLRSQDFQSYLLKELSKFGLTAERQDFTYKRTSLTNIIAKNSSQPPQIILGTHFDTRAISDRDPDPSNRSIPVPGANDGASGTAVLMELAPHLANHEKSIWLVFFDGEDQGGLNGWEWSIGAQFFVDRLSDYPEEVVIIDMIGDKDLNIYYEANSSEKIRGEIWGIAENLGFEHTFIKEQKYAVIDDQLPFINAGIPAVLIIDLDYEKWHTSEDNTANVSENSLKIVGDVLLNFLDHR